MKAYIHARLGPAERKALERLKRETGESESELVRRGLRLAEAELDRISSALEAAGRSAGRFAGPPDLSTARRHLDDFGQ